MSCLCVLNSTTFHLPSYFVLSGSRRGQTATAQRLRLLLPATPTSSLNSNTVDTTHTATLTPTTNRAAKNSSSRIMDPVIPQLIPLLLPRPMYPRPHPVKMRLLPNHLPLKGNPLHPDRRQNQPIKTQIRVATPIHRQM